MFLMNRKNLVHNSGFLLWPWGESGFSGVASDVNYGKTAARWFLQKTNGGTDAVAVSRGVNADTTDYDKWLRLKPHMEINVTALSANNTLKIRQLLDGLQDLGQMMMAVTIIASGPPGAYFYAGAGDEKERITTRGNDPVSGHPILDTTTIMMPFDDPLYTYLRVTPFESPSDTGVYRLHHVQVRAVMERNWAADGFEIRSKADEWHLIRQYIQPLQRGLLGTGTPAPNTQIRASITGPLGCGWRQTPVIPSEGVSTSITAKLFSSATLLTATPPSLTLVEADEMGAEVLINGFTGVASGSTYAFKNAAGNVPFAYLNADYF